MKERRNRHSARITISSRFPRDALSRSGSGVDWRYISVASLTSKKANEKRMLVKSPLLQQLERTGQDLRIRDEIMEGLFTRRKWS